MFLINTIKTMNHIEQLDSYIVDNAISKLNAMLVLGLKRKGFEFENKTVLMDFIKSNCKCVEQQHLKLRTYFVNDIPFLKHDYNQSIDLEPKEFNGNIALSAIIGTYYYL